MLVYKHARSEKISTTEFQAELQESVQDILNRVTSTFGALEYKTVSWKPDPSSWSINECFEHLNRYNRYYNVAIEQQIKSASGKNAKASEYFKSTWIGKFSINSVHPENLKKSKTAKHLNPSKDTLDDNVLEEFIIHQHKLLELTKTSSSVNQMKLKVSVEVLKALKISLGDCFLFMIAHQNRHINQAERVLERFNKLA